MDNSKKYLLVPCYHFTYMENGVVVGHFYKNNKNIYEDDDYFGCAKITDEFKERNENFFKKEKQNEGEY